VGETCCGSRRGSGRRLRSRARGHRARSRDPKITERRYGHLLPDFMQSEVDRLRFGIDQLAPCDLGGGEPAATAYPPSGITVADGWNPLGPATPGPAFGIPLVSAAPRTIEEAGTPPDSGTIPASLLAGCTGLEPVASGVTVGVHGVSTVPTTPNRSEPSQVGRMATAQPSQPAGPVSRGFATRLLPGSRSAPAPAGATIRVVDGSGVHLLSVRDVAARLRVSTATVYALCASGSLPHARVGNAIRIAPGDLAAFAAGRR